MLDKEYKEFIAADLEALDGTAEEIMAMLEHSIVLFIGDLGAGKTSLIKRLLEKKGIVDVASSPSFSIINEYRTQDDKAIYHFDLYRIESVEEAFSLGIEEYLYSGQLCLIEWPQIIMDYVDPPYHVLKIEVLQNNDRRILFA